MRVSNPLSVAQTSTTLGTGAMTLATPAPNGYRTFSSALTNTGGQEHFVYRIQAVGSGNVPAAAYEVGIGRLTATNELTRLSVLFGSNGTNFVNFAAGTKWCYIQTDPLAAVTEAQTPLARTDFWASGATGALPFLGAAISGGTAAALTATPSHPGIIRLNAVGVGSGYRYMTDTNCVRLAGGEFFIASVRLQATTSAIFMGFHDATTGTAPVDAACIELDSGTAAFRLRTSNNNTSTTTSLLNPSAGVWYTVTVYVYPDASTVGGAVWSEAGALLGSATHTANIPTAAGREVGIGVVAQDNISAAMVDFDFIGAYFTEAMVR